MMCPVIQGYVNWTLCPAAAVTAASGGASKLEMGEKKVEIKSKTVSIEAEKACSINGKSVLKLNSP